MKRYYNRTKAFYPNGDTQTITATDPSYEELYADTIIMTLEVAFGHTHAFVSESALKQTLHFFQILARVYAGAHLIRVAHDHAPEHIVETIRNNMARWDRKASAQLRSLKMADKVHYCIDCDNDGQQKPADYKATFYSDGDKTVYVCRDCHEGADPDVIPFNLKVTPLQ